MLVPARVPLLWIAPIWHPDLFSPLGQAVLVQKYGAVVPTHWKPVWSQRSGDGIVAIFVVGALKGLVLVAGADAVQAAAVPG
eukprot:7545142-Ditylum_brightwellii.AAC.1